MSALKNKQREDFCQEFRKDFNGTKAAIRAKYSKRSAGSTASRLLRIDNIQVRLAELAAKTAKRNEVTVDRVVEEYAKLAFSNLGDFIEIDENGDGLITLDGVSEDQLAALTEYTVETYMEGRGEGSEQVKRIKIKLSDKRAALHDMGRHLGMFDKDVLKIDPSEKLAEFFDKLSVATRAFPISDAVESGKMNSDGEIEP